MTNTGLAASIFVPKIDVISPAIVVAAGIRQP